jgi:hypothetical protein
MRDSDQRWDVVVVGTQGPRAQVLELAATLARVTGRSSGEMAQALRSGETQAHHELTRDEAETARTRLAELGALVELRASVDHHEAGPPAIGLSSAFPQLEPDPEASVRRPSVRPVSQAPATAADVQAVPDPVPVSGLTGTSGKSKPSPRRASPRARLTPANPEREIEEQKTSVFKSVGSTPRPAARVVARAPVSSAPGRTGAAQRPATKAGLAAGPTAPAGPTNPARAAKSAGPEPDAKLELDLSVLERPDSELAGPVGPANASASASAWSAQPSAPARRLLGSDPIATLLFGLAIGVAIGMMVALAATRGVTRETVLPLEEELAESLSRATEVERGRLRPPATIEADLERTLSQTRRRFFLVWLGVALPVGFVLGRIKVGD